MDDLLRRIKEILEKDDPTITVEEFITPPEERYEEKQPVSSPRSDAAAD